MSKTQWSAFWSSASQRSGAAAPGKPESGGSARSARSGGWESVGAAEKRLRKQAWSRMKADEKAHKAVWVEGQPGCRNCGGRFHVLRRGGTQNTGYPYIAQCSRCLRSAQKHGWGSESSFTDDEDAKICTLLNQHGMPVGQHGEPSPMHFYKSFLHFYFYFCRKKWDALSEHLRNHFTTTWSATLAGARQYQGWYNKTSGMYPK